VLWAAAVPPWIMAGVSLASLGPLVLARFSSSVYPLAADELFLPLLVGCFLGYVLTAALLVALAIDLRQKGLAQAAKFSWEKTAKDTLKAISARIGKGARH